MDSNARFCINSMLSERYLGRLVCHTGHACSRTGLTTLMYTVTRSNWLMPALFNWYNIYTRLAAFFTIQSMCLFQAKSLDKVTPSNFAYSTVSTILPSMTMLGIEFLTFSSGVKQITISFDFFELIFIQLLLVQLTALSIDSCITDTSVVLQISNSVLSSTYLYNGTIVQTITDIHCFVNRAITKSEVPVVVNIFVTSSVHCHVCLRLQLYGSETWTTCARQKRRLCIFHLSSICISWQESVSNANARYRYGLPSMYTLLRQRTLRWFGHIRRMRMVAFQRDILYGELSWGELPTVVTCDTTLSAWDSIRLSTSMSWEGLAADRTRWKSRFSQQLNTEEETRLTAVADEIARR